MKIKTCFKASLFLNFLGTFVGHHDIRSVQLLLHLQVHHHRRHGGGQACLPHQFIEKKFMADCPHTIGVEFGTRIIEVSGQKIKLRIWDTAGQEKTFWLMLMGIRQFCNQTLFYFILFINIRFHLFRLTFNWTDHYLLPRSVVATTQPTKQCKTTWLVWYYNR